MLERLRGRFAGPLRGVVASLAIHGLLVVLALVLTAPAARSPVKRGEPLFVELPELPEPAPQGNPAARTPGPPASQTPAPRPPAPPRAASPPSPPQAAPRPATPPSRPPVVASRPAPEPSPARPAPEPKALPAPKAAPEPPPSRDDAEAPAPKPEPTPPAAASAAPATPQPSPTPPSPAPSEPPAVAAPPASGPQVAAVPPAPPSPPGAGVDIRSALGRGGGAGSLRGGGRGGIEGEPIPLDSADPKFNDFLDRLRRRIKANWGFPCLKNSSTRACEYKTTSLVVEFGVLKDGRLQFVEVVQSSGFPIYDDYAVNAIKLSSPFPTVPPSMIVAMKQGSTGVAILARFNYVVDTSLTNLLR